MVSRCYPAAEFCDSKFFKIEKQSNLDFGKKFMYRLTGKISLFIV